MSSLQDLFKNNANIVMKQDISGSDFIESVEHAAELSKANNRYVPKVDFTNPENFAKFVSAEKYYYS
jgi:hypothetical protein